MGHRKKRVAFIPVRGGSKSIPKKNIKKIAGKPLVYWVIDAALDSNIFNDIYVSTDANDIINVVNSHDRSEQLTVVKRSKETATDTAPTESAMLEFADKYDFETITLIQATSPLLTVEDLKNGMDQFLADDNTTSLLSVCRQERFIWENAGQNYYNPINYDPQERPRRQEFNGFLVENGAFYITNKEDLINTGSRLSGNIACYEMPPETFYELDEPTDWDIIEALLKQKKTNSFAGKLKKIRLFLTDVDGVLTDAGMYYSEKGDELKKFNTRDGKGLELLRNNGIEVGIITSEDTQIVSDRARKLKVDILHQGIKNKGKVLTNILNELNLSEQQVAYIGDDINDLSILDRVGFSAAPANAIDQVKQRVEYICQKNGGEGCVREIAELILNFRKREHND